MHRQKSWVGVFMLSVLCSFFTVGGQAQLIEPTRSLQDAAEEKGLLKVLSEPPGLEVHVDGRLLGETPIFSARLPSGAHVLRIQDAEIDICLAPGKATTISWFKGRFIAIPETPKPSPEISPGSQLPPKKAKPDDEPGVRREPARDPYYWPLNPRGPIY